MILLRYNSLPFGIECCSRMAARPGQRHLLLAVASGCRHVTYPICLLLFRWPPPYWNIL